MKDKKPFSKRPSGFYWAIVECEYGNPWAVIGWWEPKEQELEVLSREKTVTTLKPNRILWLSLKAIKAKDFLPKAQIDKYRLHV